MRTYGRLSGRVVDALLAATVFGVVAVAIAADLGGTRGPEPAAFLFAGGLGALMFVRRAHPVLTLAATVAGIIAYYMADYPPIGLAVPVAAALYSTAEAGRARVALLVAAALLVVTTSFRLAEGDDPAYLFGFEFATTVGLMAAAIALGDGVRSRALLAVEQEAQARRRMEQERLRIAREVHDVLGHTVAVISVQASVAAEAVDDDPEVVRSALGVIRESADGAVRELRATVGLLRSPADQDESRAPAGSLKQLPSLVEATSESGLPVTIETEGTAVPLPSAVDTSAYRIVQEALANSLRHADATQAKVVLRYGGDTVTVSVSDDGRGWDAATADAAGAGLRGMRERAELLGGSVSVASLPGAGFRVDAVFPVELR
ncbi:sensor histidine kinase [Saccharomonospora piscinae]|uniref:sensor histidine kinase n=1 Tax=Saccharomonospora piscinae TaxID=687388 RepID=UPI0004646B2A|nr:sensor histidine kinase [Saccharomonospora piscinae]